MSARVLSFAALLAAPIAAAESPVADDLDVAVDWQFSVVDGVLEVSVTAQNTGAEAIHVLTSQGANPGGYLRAMHMTQGKESLLDREMTPEQMTGMVSRMGPMPTYTAMAASDEASLGTWRYRLPEGVTLDDLAFELTVTSQTASRVFHRPRSSSQS